MFPAWGHFGFGLDQGQQVIQEDWVPLVDPMPGHRIELLKDDGNRDGFQGRILGLLAAIFLIGVLWRQIGHKVPTFSVAEPQECQYVVAEKLFLDPLAVLV